MSVDSGSTAGFGSGARRARLLGVFAHPDDETFCAGGTFARYAGDGAEIMVVSATRGQARQIRDARVGTRRTIGAVREGELRLACERLGVAEVRCWDYADGGLAQADFAGLVRQVVQLIREFRPQVVITFGPEGVYGHPTTSRSAGRPPRPAARPVIPPATRTSWPAGWPRTSRTGFTTVTSRPTTCCS